MELDYAQIGKHTATRRKELGLKQTEVCDKAGINDKYLSCIERATSIPSLEVVIRLAQALDTTPDFFLVGSARHESNAWQGTAELLRNMSPRKLELAMIRSRVRFGMANAKAEGKQIGRPQITAQDLPATFLRHYPAYQREQLNVSELARVCDLSRTTVYKYIGLLER